MGRWMSPAEYEKTVNSGVVQWNNQGVSRMSNPANPALYRVAPKGDIHVEYEVPTSTLNGHSNGTSVIYGPNLLYAKLPGKAQSGDVPVRNITLPGSPK